jgi:hypothetical protein
MEASDFFHVTTDDNSLFFIPPNWEELAGNDWEPELTHARSFFLEKSPPFINQEALAFLGPPALPSGVFLTGQSFDGRLLLPRPSAETCPVPAFYMRAQTQKAIWSPAQPRLDSVSIRQFRVVPPHLEIA